MNTRTSKAASRALLYAILSSSGATGTASDATHSVEGANILVAGAIVHDSDATLAACGAIRPQIDATRIRACADRADESAIGALLSRSVGTGYAREGRLHAKHRAKHARCALRHAVEGDLDAAHRALCAIERIGRTLASTFEDLGALQLAPRCAYDAPLIPTRETLPSSRSLSPDVPRTLAKRLDAVAPSATLAMNARAAELRSRGIDVFPFGVGEPDFEPPAFVLEAAKVAIDKGASKYTAVTGILPLKEAICKATERSRGWSPAPKNVTVSVGAKHALFNLALALFEPGDEVIIPAPCWVSYPEQVRLVGATPVIVPTTEESGWKLSPTALAAALTPKTKAIILCSPSNPTGAAYTEAATRALLEVLAAHDCWIIVDEIYAELIYDGFRYVSPAKLARESFPAMVDRIVIVDGVSKQYAMTGWRIGWCIAPPALSAALDVVQGQSTTNPSAVAQHAAVAALGGSQEDTAKMRAIFQSRRDVMITGLRALTGTQCPMPEGAFYAFADCRSLYGVSLHGKPVTNDADLSLWLLEEAHVATVAGGAFSAPGYIRFSYATNEARIRDGLASIEQTLARAGRPVR
jgi:aspartate aminotransferase